MPCSTSLAAGRPTEMARTYRQSGRQAACLHRGLRPGSPCARRRGGHRKELRLSAGAVARFPIAYKDLCDIAGRIGPGGSKMLAKRVATETSGNMQGCIVAAALEQC